MICERPVTPVSVLTDTPVTPVKADMPIAAVKANVPETPVKTDVPIAAVCAVPTVSAAN